MTRAARTLLGVALAVILVGGAIVLLRNAEKNVNRTHVVAYFENSNGIYAGDDVRIVGGVPVGRIESIEPQPTSVKISFWYDSKYDVPADVSAAILSPTLVTARSLQLTPPVYTGGPPVMENNAVIPQERTAVPVEWDEVRRQLETLSETLQPTEPGGVSPPLGSVINTAATTCVARAPTSVTPSSSCRRPSRRSAITAPTSSPP